MKTPPQDRPRRRANSTPTIAAPKRGQEALFPVVGIGCSAGGLEALEQFLTHVPKNTGMAFVIVQHLAPDRPSAMPDLLRRITPLPVVEAEEGMLVQPDGVYVIRPNCDLSLLHGRLHLLEPAAPRGMRLPIDYFLGTLAAERKDKAVGVILSGMGSDGVVGLRAIKERGGLTLVQEPSSAQAESMPRSAMEAGVVDVVAPAGVLPSKIIYCLNSTHENPLKLFEPTENLNGLDKIVQLLREHSGNDFSLYKSNTLCRRIERRMAVHQFASVESYVTHLRGNPQELDLLFKELLIGVTSFFRDAEVWDLLRQTSFPAMLAQYPSGRTLRAWVPACSTGEEAYSLAIVFQEALALAAPAVRYTLQIYATDLDSDAIDAARKGFYPSSIAADVSAERLARHFIPVEGGGYRIAKEIREMVVFAPQNLISDPPFTRLDILCCRNALIYFGADLQKRLLPRFYYALNRDGLLLLGSAESVGNYGHLFAPVHNKARLFRRLDVPLSSVDLAFPARGPAAPPSEALATERPEDLGQLTDQLIQQNWAPAAVLVNAEGDILYISGRTGKYLEPAAGKTNISIHAMAREGLRQALTGVIRKALRDPLPIHLNSLKVDTNGGTQIVDVTVQAIEKPEALRGRVMIVFRDVAVPAARRKSKKQIGAETDSAIMLELRQTREALQATHEELQSTVEEFKSSNEELQSTNEELQSTNEELTTSREELQSLNEELLTVNAELQSKVDDLAWVSNDMENLLNSTEIATIFLDNELKLRRFTTFATQIFRLIPGDIGRPLSDVASDLDYPQLADEAREVLRTLVFRERVTSARDSRWYRVRVMPYRTLDNVIDGLVVTFIDITEIKILEAELRKHGSDPAAIRERQHAR